MDVKLRVFTLIRAVDSSGISGTGRILDGIIFHTGQVVTCWRADINAEEKGVDGYSTLGIYPSFEAFLHVHVKPHPEESNKVIFFDIHEPVVSP